MDDVTEITVPIDDEDNDSVIGRLRSLAKSVAEETTVDFDIPGYEGTLFARYRVLDSSELDAIRKKVRNEVKNPSEQVTAASLDTLIAACEEFWVREENQEISLRQVTNKELPVRYDQVLAEALGFEDELENPPSARSCVIALFGGNGLAAQAHSAMVSQWMLRINLGVDQQLGGI